VHKIVQSRRELLAAGANLFSGKKHVLRGGRSRSLARTHVDDLANGDLFLCFPFYLSIAVQVVPRKFVDTGSPR
jgi:hypothetical protein